MKHCFASARFAVLPFTLVLLPAAVLAQQTPVTGQMMGGQGAAVDAASMHAAPVPPQPSTVVTNPLGSSAAAVSAASRQPMVAPPAPARVASSDTPPPAVLRSGLHATVVGETTQSLLQMQADGTQAGKHLPMLGAEASASYDRYLKSFSHDIPEFYKTNVGKDSNGTAGGE